MWILTILATFVIGITSQGYYKVIGPRTIRPNSEYHAAVTVFNTPVPTVVTAALAGRSNSGKAFSVEQILNVRPNSTTLARLQVGDIEPGDYRLLVRGRGGLEFDTSSPVRYLKKSYSIFVQTDKTIYKPGTKILFRVLILNAQLKPAVVPFQEPVTIYISDGQNNIVKEWKDVNAPSGIFTEELQLSKNPVLGNWNITTKVHGEVYNKTIRVSNYILPKFLINIQTPKHITFKENILTVYVQTLYNYGKKVKGDATVTVFPTINSGVIQPIFQNPVRKVIPIHGSATVNFDIANELKLTDEYERNVIIDVTVEEALTGRRQNNSVEIQVHKYNYKMELIKTADYYKPGLKYTAYVKVMNHENIPLSKDRKSVTIRYGYSRADEIYIEEEHTLDSNGMLKLELYPPSNSTNETALRIEAEYYGLKERMPPIPAARSASNNFLQATLETEHPSENKDVEILVNSTEPMRYINYQLLGKGDVLIANTFKIDNRKEYRFRFVATHAMAPTSHLLVNYIRDDGELVADALDIDIDGLFQNFIDIQLNKIETRPESDVDFTIKSKPNSQICLLAVDQTVNSIGTGYDLNQLHVSEELHSYDVSDASPYINVMKNSMSHFHWKHGSSNAHDMFYDSGALLLSNSVVNSFRPTLEDIYLRPVSHDSSTVKPDRGAGLSFHSITRPPLAGPYAFSRIPRPVWNKPKVYLAKEVYDTWLFTNFSSGFDGVTSIRRKLPNSLNTWTITGFSLDPVHGLGITSSPKKIKVSKEFVVTLDLPHAIERRETLSVPVVVYNFMSKDIIAEVTLHNPEQKFKFADVDNEGNATKKIELYRRKKVTIKGNSGSSVSFMIVPLILGDIEIKASSSSSNVQDSVTKYLKVKAEGETEYYTKTLLIDLRKKSVFSSNITFEIPKNIVDNSELIEVSVIGDLLGTTIMNMEHLIRLPVGCAEQNLVTFLPNLILLNYLRNTNQLTPTIQKEAISRLETGYQEQLSYKHPDGSFSAFGKPEEMGSIWITAYTIFSLVQAKRYIYVDDKIIYNGYDWLAEKQAPNGSFVEAGTVIHNDMQGRNGDSLALTAFAVMAFMEFQATNKTYTNTISKGLDYIARNIDENENVYTVAICSYVLHLAEHTSKRSTFNLLEIKSKTKDGLKWWGEDIPEIEKNNPWNTLPKSLDIEATSYGLLTLIEANLIDDAIPVINWLVNQQNSLGGFSSSHDTTIALLSLYKLVLKLSAPANMRITYATKKQETSMFSINRENAMIVQKVQIQRGARLVNVSAEGTGLALFRVSYQYNTNVTGPWPMFTLDPQVDKNSNQHHLQLSICTAFVSKNLTEDPASNMAIMEVNLPSGFTADIDSLPSLEVSQNVQKVQTANGDTTVLLYFNNLTKLEYCPTVSAFQTHKVAVQKPAHVSVYDYYDSSRHARIFFRGRTSTLCSICEEEDCGEVCKNEAEQQISAESREAKGSCVSIRSRWIIVFTLFAIIIAYR